MSGRLRAPAEILDDVVSFPARVTRGKCAYVTVPIAYARGLRSVAWPRTLSVRIRADDDFEAEFVADLITQKPRGVWDASTQILLPVRVCQRFRGGEPVQVILRKLPEVVTQQAAQLVDGGALTHFDLLPFAPERTVESPPGSLLLRGLRGDVRLRRRVRITAVSWLAGLYQAEGSKSEGAVDFTVTLANPYLLQEFVRVLCDELGLSREALSLEVLHDTEEDAAQVRSFWTEIVELPATSVRPRQGRGRSAGCVRVRNSKPLLQLFKNWIAHLLGGGLAAQPPEGRLAFVLGFLDGDGGLTVARSVLLGFYDQEHVATLVHSTLETALHWTPRALTRTGACNFMRCLALNEMADLVRLGAFRHTLARARLLLALQARLRVLLPVWRKFGPREFTTSEAHAIGFDPRGYWRSGSLVRGTTRGVHRLGEAVLRVAPYYEELAVEIEAWQRHVGELKDAVQGVKGRWSPLIERDRALYDDTCAKVLWGPAAGDSQRRVRALQAKGAPETHHPTEKQAQIRKVLTGATNLTIYEAFGGHGYCTQAFSEFGVVTARTARDGDAQRVTHAEIAAGRAYDVVDLDSYGFPTRILFGGALELLRQPGWLFFTFPNPRRHCRGAAARGQMVAFLNVERPEIPDVEAAVQRHALGYGRTAQLVDVLDLRTVWRFAFRVDKQPTI